MADVAVPGGKVGGQDGFIKNPVPLSNGGGTPDLYAGDTPQASTSPEKKYDFLSLARDNFNTGKNYFDIAVRKRMEDNLAHAYSRHASGSKFFSPEYDKRSKIFRPKTRAMMRKLEATGAIAVFSTRDVLDCEAADPNDVNGVLAAEVKKELANYRFRKTVPWFKIVMGALHDAMTTGVIFSCQEWLYQEASIDFDEVDESGNPTGNVAQNPIIVKDTPGCRLVPVENLLMHPSSDWTDPVNSSPFLIEMIPWFIPELAERIRNAKQFGSQVPYRKVFTEEELMQGMSEQSNSAVSVRMAREHSRLDRISQVQQGTNFRMAWVHRNIVRINGLDYVYETLGTNVMLSDPVPIEDVFGIRRRPYVGGSCAIEPHRLYPSGPVEMTKGLQDGINDVTNQRRDNVMLALNGRYLVKRGQMVDSRSLMRNVPGSITMTTDPTGDVKMMETKDVTSSSYQEQDRFNQEFDEIAGQYTAATVSSIKNQDGQVGTNELLGNNADIIAELTLQTIAKTWMEPVITQILELESAFESDEVVLKFVSSRTNSQDWMQAFRALQSPVDVTVNIGYGATDPMKKLQRFTVGFQAIQQIAPDLAQQADQKEVVHEIMGALGYKDGIRFFPSLKADGKTTPQEQALQKQIDSLSQQLQQAQAGIPVAKIKADASIEIAKIKGTATQNVAVAKLDAERFKANLQGQIKRVDQEIAREGNTIKKAGLLLEREALSHSIMEADRAFELQVATLPAVSPAVRAELSPNPLEEPLAENLLRPEAGDLGASMSHAESNGSDMNLPGNDAAGVIDRGNYGAIPGQEG
jgi:hypothetical protein